MQTRLLSFLTDFERAVMADEPAPADGIWVTRRAVNFQSGLARLELNTQTAKGLRSSGQCTLQSYQLADGTPCLKAVLSWPGTDATVNRSIYTKPLLSWTREARQLAAEWLGGFNAAPVVQSTATPDRQFTALEAAG